MPWVIFDFAGVIGLHQSQADQDAIVAAAAGPPATSFWEAYWSHRPDYDAGAITAAEYWLSVAPGADYLRLVELDIASWLNPNREMLDLLAGLAGRDLALLSNSPPELAAAVDSLPWLMRLTRRFYSCRLGMVKPSQATYLAVAGQLGVAPASCTFVDDRADNVAGAQDAGMTGILFTDARSLRERLLLPICALACPKAPFRTVV